MTVSMHFLAEVESDQLKRLFFLFTREYFVIVQTPFFGQGNFVPQNLLPFFRRDLCNDQRVRHFVRGWKRKRLHSSRRKGVGVDFEQTNFRRGVGFEPYNFFETFIKLEIKRSAMAARSCAGICTAWAKMFSTVVLMISLLGFNYNGFRASLKPKPFERPQRID